MTIRQIALAVTLAGLLAINLPLRAATQILDQVVAIVDDDIIMASELRERIETVNNSITARGIKPPPEDELIRETLDRLILESIQLQMGQKFGVRISDAQLNGAMQRVAAQNRMTLEQFRQALEQQREQ